MLPSTKHSPLDNLSRERTSVGQEERERIMWEPFDVWAPRIRLERGIDPKDDSQTSVLKAEFARLLSNPEVGAKKVRSQWCLPRFVGLIEDCYSEVVHSNASSI